MAVNTKGSRRIEIDGTEFRWRATGNDDWISVVVWPAANDRTRVVGNIGYHQEAREVAEGHYTLHNQVVVTNRIIRRLILHCGVEECYCNEITKIPKSDFKRQRLSYLSGANGHRILLDLCTCPPIKERFKCNVSLIER